MKKIITITLLCALMGCDVIQEHTYTLEVVYTNGDREVFTTTNKYSEWAINGTEPHLQRGELRSWDGVMRSGVRSYKVIKEIK
jgi:hypothetical protein